LDQRFADVAYDFAARCFLVRVEIELRQHVFHDRHVVSSLLEILFPFFFQVVILGAADCRRVNLDTAELGFERLVQEFA
jgi:hypothetical protein